MLFLVLLKYKLCESRDCVCLKTESGSQQLPNQYLLSEWQWLSEASMGSLTLARLILCPRTLHGT